MTNEESKAKAEQLSAKLKELGIADTMRGSVDIIDRPVDLRALEFARATLAATVEYLRANLEHVEPGITRNPFMPELRTIDVAVMRQAVYDEVCEILGGQFQITEVDGNMKRFAIQIVDAVLDKAAR